MKQYIEWEASDFEAMDDKVTQALTRVTALEKQHDDFKQAMVLQQSAQDAKLSSLDKDSKAQAADVTAIKAVNTAQDTKINDLTSWKNSANSTMLANEKGVADLKKADVDLDARLDKAEPVLVALATRLDQNDAKDKGQDSVDASLASRAALMESFKASITQTLTDYAARLAKLENPPLPIVAEGPSEHEPAA